MQILLVQVEVQVVAYPTNKYFKVVEHLLYHLELHKYMHMCLAVAVADLAQVLTATTVVRVATVD
jgi:hypothetical protein